MPNASAPRWTTGERGFIRLAELEQSAGAWIYLKPFFGPCLLRSGDIDLNTWPRLHQHGANKAANGRLLGRRLQTQRLPTRRKESPGAACSLRCR